MMSMLPINNIIVLPGSKLWLQNSIYTQSTDKAPLKGEKVTLLAQKDEDPQRPLSAENFRPIGVVGVISEVNDSGLLCIDIQNRVNVEDIVRLPDGSFSMTLSRRPDIDDLEREDARKRLDGVKERILQFSKGQQWEGMIRNFAASWSDLWTVGTSLSPWLGLPADERYALLAEDSLSKRFDALERVILEGLERISVQAEARTAQQEKYEKLYRESAIKKQIEYLQKELDEMHPENVSELRRMELKLDGSGMNETALRESRKVL